MFKIGTQKNIIAKTVAENVITVLNRSIPIRITCTFKVFFVTEGKGISVNLSVLSASISLNGEATILLVKTNVKAATMHKIILPENIKDLPIKLSELKPSLATHS